MGPPISDNDHLARYCRPASFDDDGKATYTAFLLRAGTPSKLQEPYLSAFLLEVLQGTNLEERLADLRREVRERRVFSPKKTGKYAALNVGRMRRTVNERSADKRWLRVTREEPPFFHAGIYDTAADEETIANAISDSVLSYHPA